MPFESPLYRGLGGGTREERAAAAREEQQRVARCYADVDRRCEEREAAEGRARIISNGVSR